MSLIDDILEHRKHLDKLTKNTAELVGDDDTVEANVLINDLGNLEISCDEECVILTRDAAIGLLDTLTEWYKEDDSGVKKEDKGNENVGSTGRSGASKKVRRGMEKGV